MTDNTDSPKPRSATKFAEKPDGVSASEHAISEIRNRLAGGVLRAGDKLQSEPQLALELGVSRVSIRTALAQLESEGLINRRKGAGTYVNSLRPLVHSFHHNVSADQLISQIGYTPGIYELSWKHSTADEEIAEKLKLEVGDPIIDIYRVRTSDGRPVTIEHDYFSTEILPQKDFRVGASLFAFLSEECGIDIAFGVAELEPGLVGEEYAKVLETSADSLCLIVSQVDFDVSERPISYSIEYHLADAFNFRLVRQGPGNVSTGNTAK
ncbi:GntR family transcriptional regulator [Glutamicibacter sp. MNS18]|uniref:GntR family transcriptional regulator n=1 Tax=Glutamicibacter sp. MNS18 TaxID=2989817 RepID=UPI002235C8C7|nr:GntR family transcriptional regulator [Glutamicibacter sp. MNS18]MCW4466789.1 GntR family transcriptional regulator [Glutamicibacter sp. MNS18]